MIWKEACEIEPRQLLEVLLERSRELIYPRDVHPAQTVSDAWRQGNGSLCVYSNDTMWIITAQFVFSSFEVTRHRLGWHVNAYPRGGRREQENFMRRRGYHLPSFEVENGELLRWMMAEIRASEAMSGKVRSNKIKMNRWKTARWQEHAKWYREWRAK